MKSIPHSEFKESIDKFHVRTNDFYRNLVISGLSKNRCNSIVMSNTSLTSLAVGLSGVRGLLSGSKNLDEMRTLVDEKVKEMYKEVELMSFLIFDLNKTLVDRNNNLIVLILGMSGSGKSTIGNVLTSSRSFEPSVVGEVDSKTKRFEVTKSEFKGHIIEVIDSVGFVDTNDSVQDQIQRYLQYLIKLVKVNTVIYVHGGNRSNGQSNNQLIQAMNMMFGGSVEKRIRVFYNHMLDPRLINSPSKEDQVSSNFVKSPSVRKLLPLMKERIWVNNVYDLTQYDDVSGITPDEYKEMDSYNQQVREEIFSTIVEEDQDPMIIETLINDVNHYIQNRIRAIKESLDFITRFIEDKEKDTSKMRDFLTKYDEEIQCAVKVIKIMAITALSII